MAFEWKTKAEEGTATADVMPEGYHHATVTKAIMAKGDGTPLKSQNGDQQILTILENKAGEEATITFTLNEKASGILASFLMHAGADLDRMQKDGIEPSHFEDEDFAKKNLINRELWVHVQHRKGNNDKTYANARSVSKDDVPPHELQRAKAGASTGDETDANSIPF